MSSPISFEQFKSNPTAGIAFVAIIAVMFLFYELRTSHKIQLESQEARIETLENKLVIYEDRLEEVNKRLIECISINKP